MNEKGFKRRALGWARQHAAAFVAGLLAALALGAPAAAQDCPNIRQYGAPPSETRLAGEARGVEVKAVYFRTQDKNAFLPEVEGRRWNPAFLTVTTDAFRDKLTGLLARGTAAVEGRRAGALSLGDAAALERGRHPLLENAGSFDLAPRVLDAKQVMALDRYTTFSVTHRPGEPFYRLQLLSWFVEARPDGSGWMTVDIDSGLFLRHGETQVVKFLSDYEVKRTGSERTYVALSLVPVADGDGDEWSSTQRPGGPARGN